MAFSQVTVHRMADPEVLGPFKADVRAEQDRVLMRVSLVADRQPCPQRAYLGT